MTLLGNWKSWMWYFCLVYNHNSIFFGNKWINTFSSYRNFPKPKTSIKQFSLFFLFNESARGPRPIKSISLFETVYVYLVHFCPYISVCFGLFLSISVRLYPLLSICFPFVRFMSVSVCFRPFLSASVSFCLFLSLLSFSFRFSPFLSVSVHFCQLVLSFCVCFSQFMFIYPRLFQFLSVFVRFCQFLSVSVHFSPFLTVSAGTKCPDILLLSLVWLRI